MKYSFLFQLGDYAIGMGGSPTVVTRSTQTSVNVVSSPLPLLQKPEDISVSLHPDLKAMHKAGRASFQGGQLIVLLGLTGSGKTTMLDRLLVPNGINMHKIIFGEPEGVMVSTPALLRTIGHTIEDLVVANDYDYKPIAGASSEAIEPIEFALGYDIPSGSEVGIIAIDSLRKFFYAPGGSTGAGGVNNEMFMLLTELSVFARRTGLTFLVTLNPLLDDEEKLAGLASRIAGSVDTTILLEGRPADTGSLSFKISSRYWPSRQWVSGNVSTALLGKISAKEEMMTFEEAESIEMAAPNQNHHVMSLLIK